MRVFFDSHYILKISDLFYGSYFNSYKLMTKCLYFVNFYRNIYWLTALGLFCLTFNGEHVFVKFLLRHFKNIFHHHHHLLVHQNSTCSVKTLIRIQS